MAWNVGGKKADIARTSSSKLRSTAGMEGALAAAVTTCLIEVYTSCRGRFTGRKVSS